MKATELIGKQAIRSRYCEKDKNNFFTEHPCLILGATKNHIFVKYFKDEEYNGQWIREKHAEILTYEYCDDNWQDASELCLEAKFDIITREENIKMSNLESENLRLKYKLENTCWLQKMFCKKL